MNYTFDQLTKMKKNEIINMANKLNLDIRGNKNKLIYRIIDFQKNDKIININNREYILTEFGKTKKIEKSDFEKFIKDKGLNYTVPDSIFKKALNIFNNKITDISQPSNVNNKLNSNIQPGSTNISKRNNVSTINNNIKTKNFSKKCKNIKSQYNFPSKEKDIFKNIYNKKVQTINPGQCNSIECQQQYIELNKDYKYYMTNC